MSEKLNQEIGKMTNGVFFQKLARVQSELNAPKDKKNSFGGYNYRNVENIYEAVKPLLLKEGLVLSITDEVIEISDRIYIKATATVTDGFGSLSATGFARETGMKKGMDEAQITGSCSSYARKYALGGLFLIDDNKDIDSLEPEKEKSASTDKKSEKEVETKSSSEAGKPKKSDDELANKATVDKMIAEFEKIGIKESEVFKYFGLTKATVKSSDIPNLRAYFLEQKKKAAKQKAS